MNAAGWKDAVIDRIITEQILHLGSELRMVTQELLDAIEALRKRLQRLGCNVPEISSS